MSNSGQSRGGKVAKRYAKALFEVCQEDRFDAIQNALNQLAKIWDENVELRTCLNNPGIKFDERLDVVTALAGKVLSGEKVLANFMSTLLSNKRLGLLSMIAAYFAELVSQHRAVVPLEITSAFQLSDQEKMEFERQVTQTLNASASFTWNVDYKILGGVLIKSGDRLLDCSVNGALNRLHENLIA